MSTSPPVTNGQQRSVFNALGSYADRIKEQQAAAAVAAKSASASGPSTSMTANGDGPRNITPSSTSTVAKGKDHKTVSSSNSTAAVSPATHAPEDDGPWEKVQSTRQRRPEEKRGGSSSKNWRDRSHRDDQREKHGADSDKRSGGHSRSSKKNASSSAPPGSTAAIEKTSNKSTFAATATTSKLAWSAIASGSQSTPSRLPATASVQANVNASGTSQSQTTPSSPSLNGTTVTPTASVPASIASPSLNSDTASSSTAVSKAGVLPGDEGSWRNRPKAKEQEQMEEPQPPASRKPAPPPAVNAWEVRKKTLTPSIANVAAESAPALPNTNGNSPRTQPNGTVKPVPKRRTHTATSTVVPSPINDAALWPDVSQAAEVAKSTEEKKEKIKEKDNSEATSVVDDTAGGGKKPKWTPIPAAELLAAADQAAETTRRQGRLEAKKRLAAKGDAEFPAQVKGAKARKGPTSASPVDTKKGQIKPARDGSGSEIRTQAASQGQRDGSQAGSKVASETAAVESVTGAATVNGDAKAEDGSGDASLSRQASRQSMQGSPQKVNAQYPSPGLFDAASHIRNGSGSLQSKPMSGSTTAPLPQHTFNPASISNLPRPPRGRDGRASFNGRGRGFRSNSALPHKGHIFGSPPTGAAGLPMDGMPFANGTAFSRGYAAGFQPFYPVSGFAPAAIYDPMQAQYGNLAAFRGAPPPPMPQTVVPNLDSTRFYVLGQVEYYFSMQNLAMDFFLRQQMDSEGWIDIAMIASFNRVKSITPDVAIVRECMTLSSLLEVREERVRLAGPGSRQWVLPGAKPSEFGLGPISPSVGMSADDSRDVSMGIPASVEASFTPSVTSTTDEAPSNGQQTVQQSQGLAQHQRAFVAADVENALMKSSVPTSSTASVMNGDEKTETVTPATSTSGDGGKEDEENKVGQSY
ncbi:hypothetical protein IAR55_005220 [Kwoniella newhampshirensis]|uniref:HTH La-type RNA-binding domain-containing protein n=1 Tax=Kwoniella newhampshirensis TaxID=1651941 RepID=A0AAW0YTC1_9TREE